MGQSGSIVLQSWFPVNNNGDFVLHDLRNSSFKKIEGGLMKTTELPIVVNDTKARGMSGVSLNRICLNTTAET
jgi:hypothetical protein